MNRSQLTGYFNKLEPIPTLINASGRPKHILKCILFDIYGTLFISASGDIGLLNSNPVRQQGLKRLLEEFGLKVSVTELVEALIDAIKDSHHRSANAGVAYPEVDILAVWRSILVGNLSLTESRIREFAIKFELTVNPVFPMPGLKDCLLRCRKSGLKLGIISNAQFYTPLLFEWFLDATLNQLGFSDELLFFSFQFGIAKPSTTLFAAAAERLNNTGIASQNVLYLGNDMLKDIVPAHQTGFQTALFAGDARSLRMRENESSCRFLKPDMVIVNLLELTTWL